MPVLLDNNQNQYSIFEHKNEAEFEKIVKKLADHMFGPDTIYVDVKKRLTGKSIFTIPDGYMIDMTVADSPKLYVVENEISTHDLFKHIGIQLLKFATCYDGMQTDLKDLLMTEIQKDKELFGRLEVGCKKSKTRNVDFYLEQAVKGGFRAVVITDGIKQELNDIIKKIDADISVMEVKTYVSDKNEYIYQFDTLYDELDESVDAKTPRERLLTRTELRSRRAKCDTVVVPARKEGFKRVFIGENQWYEIRIGAAMKDKIKYIAAYQVAPISAVTHIAEVQEIKPYKDTNKYIVVFKGPAKEIKHLKLNNPNKSPQGPMYVEYDKLVKSIDFDSLLER